jgi:hypothetical protein
MSGEVKGKRGRPRKSIWEHFTEVSISNNNSNEAGSSSSIKKRPGAKCNYCKQQWARGKSSDMIAHIALSCTKPPPPEVRTKFYEILRNGEDSDEEGFIEQPKKRQTKITEHAEKLTISDDKQRRGIRALTKFFICCGIPFWIVENPFFVDFIKSLCPGFQLPKRTALSTTLVNNECAYVLSEIKKELDKEINLTLG